jgi:sugar O-acyltransferase (sialic acid O-acetyltransferase NeuD family)
VTAVILWGAKGHAKVVREALRDTAHQVVATFDSDPMCPAPFDDIPFGHGWAAFEAWQTSGKAPASCRAVVCIGGDRGVDRVSLQRSLADRGIPPLQVRHRTAFIADDAVVGAGCQILAHASVCVESVLEDGCIVNTSASVDHECRLGVGVHVCPGAHLAGCVSVGRYATIYTGAVILPWISIGEGAIVAAGAVVTRDVPPYTLVGGNPARRLRTLAAPRP